MHIYPTVKTNKKKIWIQCNMNSISYFRQALAIDIILISQTTKILLKI